MSNYSTILMISNDESSRYLSDALVSIGMQDLGQVNISNTNYHFSPDDINNITLALVGSGGLVTAITSYFKYRTKQFEVKLNKEGFTEIKCSNMSKEEIKSILNDIKKLNCNADK